MVVLRSYFKQWLAVIAVFVLFMNSKSFAQTYNFNTSSASEIEYATDMYNHGAGSFPIALNPVWNNDWWYHIRPNLSHWGDSLKFKSLVSYVKFQVYHEYPKPTTNAYNYRITYQLIGYTNPADTVQTYTTINDTLTIGYNPDSLSAFQDIQLKRYTGFYKIKVTLTGLYNYTNPSSPVSIPAGSIPNYNFYFEAAIITQDYNKFPYGSSTSLITSVDSSNVSKNYLGVNWQLSSGASGPIILSPANYELEWTYVDNYSRNLTTGAITSLTPSQMAYDFRHNSTRVWLDTNYYPIPLVYPGGAVVYRVRMVRPDSILYKYPIYSAWSVANDSGSVASAGGANYYYIWQPYTNDSLNWQYTVSFAEGGKYKNVLSFYDGLLKNRESITRFNSNPNNLIVTQNVYDYEGRPSIKILPTPVNSSTFSYQHNVSLNANTHLPYQASDFDTLQRSTCPGEPMIASLDTNALASIYYSHRNPDIASVPYEKFVPDAQGYPLIETVYDPSFNDRVLKQGGAGPLLQIADSNIIQNEYVNADQEMMNRYFGLNIGNSAFYTKIMSQDPNRQMSLSIKDYKGKQILSSMSGTGPSSLNHAIVPLTVPNATWYTEDLIAGTTQEIIGNQRILDKQFYMEASGVDTAQYIYSYTPFQTVCPGKYLTVKASYHYQINDQCGNLKYQEDSTLGITGVTSLASATPFTGTKHNFGLDKGPQTVHKTLTIHYNDVTAAVDSFMNSPNCLVSLDSFIRQSVESRTFPCPANNDDECAKKKAQMASELFPGGKYGQFTYTSYSPVKVDGSNSIFTEYHFTVAGRDTFSYRYQNPCIVTLPSYVVWFNDTIRNLQTMRVDSFIAIYSYLSSTGDYSIADSLLPLHPEYCQLQNCYTDTFKNTLLAIPNAQTAIGLNLFSLDSIVAHDPIVTKLQGSPYFVPDAVDSLKRFPGGRIRLDSIALLKAYCGCSDSVQFNECIAHIFNKEIASRKLTNPFVQNSYFSDIIELYLQNREKFKNEMTGDGGNKCKPCDSVRMTLTPSAVFPTYFTSTGGLALGSGAWTPFTDTSLGIMTTLLSSMTTDTLSADSLKKLEDSTTSSLKHIDSVLTLRTVDSILGHLPNCTQGSSTLTNALRNTLDSLFGAGVVHDGNFTPAQVRFALVRNSIQLTDLCNPYLISYDYFGPAAQSGGGGCKDPSYYNAIQSFLNQSTITAAFVSAAQTSPSTPVAYTLSATSTFETAISNLTGTTAVNVFATYQPAHNFYTLFIYKPSAPIDTVKIYLRGGVGCVNSYHPNKANDTFNISSVACVNSVPGAVTLGYINDLSFIATLSHTSYGLTTSCSMLGWTDSIETLDYSLNPISATVPCTQIRSLFTQLQDSMALYGVKGMDHPFYDDMLENFMSFNLQQSFPADQIRTFITSCALADTTTIPDYVAYATLVFSNSGGLASTNAASFVTGLAAVDPLAFVNPYREKDASGNITIQVDFNQFPDAELYKYSSYINGYSATGVTKYLNQPLSNTQAANTLGYVYYPPTYNFLDTASVIFNTASTNVSFSAPITRNIWRGGRFITQTYKMITYVAGTPPYELSKDIYQLHSYIYNHSIPLTFVSNLESTVNSDYFKPQKTAYLQGVYKYQNLPPYEVLDSLQAIFLQQRIALFNSDFLSYTRPFDPTTITNLYIADPTANSHYYDTLKTIFNLVAANTVNPGSVFFTNNSQMIAGNLYAYRCSDGTYWYRYFGKGDTLYNAYVQMPSYVKVTSAPLYHITGIGTLPAVQPIPGDSTSRFFVLNLQIGTDTTTRIQATGMTDFVIAKNIELDNVLMGNKLINNSSYAPLDTFNNCERTTLKSAVVQGKVNYKRYIDSIRRYEVLAFMDALMNGVNEELLLGYRDQDFNYTLYYYDRADNLIQTVPPAGVHALDTNVALLARVDTTRIAGLDTGTVLYPKHNKISTYSYNSSNELASQTTPDGGRTDFYYDIAGRLVFSQNDKQFATGSYTYNMYDALGRIIETGEIPGIGATWGRDYKVTIAWYTANKGSLTTPYAAYINNSSGLVTISPAPAWILQADGYSNSALQSYIKSYNRNDVVMTIYDTAATQLNLVPGLDAQINLRKRVACVKYFKTIASSDLAGANYTYATHYSYDVDGNVKTLVQDFPALKSYTYQRYKRIDYDYDLISGKVNMLSYNRGFSDQYYQQYSYDADNRITSVQTSNDGLIWKNDASYQYYEHGPLARVVLGDQKVQGLDYAYTIQGWLKALNGDTLNTSMDMGGDGALGSIVSKDAVAHTIDYFTGDYAPIGTQAVTHVPGPALNLYNGNISRQTEAIGNFMRLNKQYIYDQLNRINNTTYASVSAVNNTLTGLKDYSNSYQYDADGNLLMLTRYGNSTKTGGTLASPVLMDSLTYYYPFAPVNNRLRQVTDQAANSYTNDIAQFTDTTKNRYLYDAIGNTIKDQVSGQDTIQWNLYNKVTYTSNSTAKNNMTFVYDGAGNRVAKYFSQANDTGSVSNNDYYVRDAQGNVLATYHQAQVYKLDAGTPLHWVPLVNGGVRTGLGGSHPFNGTWTVPTYATDGNFVGAIMSESQQNSGFTNTELASPVSEFMNNSTAVYTNMLMNSPAWVVPNTQYDLSNPSVAVLKPALNKVFTVNNTSLGVPFLQQLFTNPNPSMNQYALSLMCSSGDMTLINALAVLLGRPTGQVCNTEAASLMPYLPAAGGLMSMFHTLQVQHPTQFLSYCGALTTDNTIYTNSFYAAQLTATLQPMVNIYGVKANVTAFFDSWSGAHAELTSVNSTSALLQVKYNENALTYVNALDDAAGDAMIDNAIAAIPGLSFTAYVNNIIAVTHINPNVSAQNVLKTDSYYLGEHDIYGSGRLGIKQYYPTQLNASYDYTTTPAKADTLRLFNTVPWYSLEYQDDIMAGDVDLYGHALLTTYGTQHQAGQRQYEVTDHLGDVLATLSDKRRGIDPGSTGSITGYVPSPVALYDYYPFGMLMPGRYVSDTANHCELVTETAPVLTTGTIGRLTLGSWCIPCGFTAVGSGIISFGGSSMTTTSTVAGDGAAMDVSTISGTPYTGSITASGMSGGSWTATAIDITSATVLAATTIAQPQTATLNFTAIGPSTRITLAAVTASSTFTITAIPLNFTTWTAGTIVTTVCSKNNDAYRYGFNGKLKDNEWAGVGNSLDYGMRMEDTRIGRFRSVDPLTKDYPMLTTYQFSSNNPILGIDKDGLEMQNPMLYGWLGQTFAAVSDWWNKSSSSSKSAVDGYQIQMGQVPIDNKGATNGDAVMWSIAAAANAYSSSYMYGGVNFEEHPVAEPVGEPVAEPVGTAKVKTADAESVKPADYSSVPDPKNAGPGKKFTAAQKKAYIKENMKQNGGVIKSDKSGEILSKPVQSKKGVKANMKQAEVDHVIPRSKGGKNTSNNAQILSKEENLKKSNN